MLIDQENSNVLPLTDELIECLLDSRDLGFGVHNEEVLGCAWGGGNVLICQKSTISHRELSNELTAPGCHLPGDGEHTPMPERSKPVTVSYGGSNSLAMGMAGYGNPRGDLPHLR